MMNAPQGDVTRVKTMTAQIQLILLKPLCHSVILQHFESLFFTGVSRTIVIIGLLYLPELKQYDILRSGHTLRETRRIDDCRRGRFVHSRSWI